MGIPLLRQEINLAVMSRCNDCINTKHIHEETEKSSVIDENYSTNNHQEHFPGKKPLQSDIDV